MKNKIFFFLMCGIIGFLGNCNSTTTLFTDYVLSGLKLLRNRGYDSVGISFIVENQLNTIKHASTQINDSFEKLEREVELYHENTNDNKKNQDKNDTNAVQACIGHTRWATHGGKTKINAHPHHDHTNRIALVHNGIIENFEELKIFLFSKNIQVISQTDTEIISCMIGYFLDEGFSMESSIQQTISKLSGTWALVIIHRDLPNKMWITRYGSPLLLGLNDNFVLVASEQIAFGNGIQKYITLDNHDIIEITSTNDCIVYNKNIQSYEIKETVFENIEHTPAPFPHWMIKEIYEQPHYINCALNNGGRIETNTTVKLGGLDQYKQQLLELNHIILLGCGTSYHAGLWAIEIFKDLDIFDTVSIYDGAEFEKRDIPKKGKTGFILLTQSGETKDLHRCLQYSAEYEIITIGVVNVKDSLIARETTCGVYLNAGREVSVASTKSFTNQCIILSLIAIWFSQNRNTCILKRTQMIQDLIHLSLDVQQLLYQCQSKQTIHNIVDVLYDKIQSPVFLLGKGQEEAIAKEGSLKLKEISYINAQGYSSSALKHGPFALIVPELPIILFDVNDKHRDKNNNCYQEIVARGANVICITDYNRTEKIIENTNTNNNILHIKKNQTFGGVISNIYIQYISYLIAIKAGQNPDYPRNLAKVVTVE